MPIAKWVELCIIFAFVSGCSSTDYYYVVEAELVNPAFSNSNCSSEGVNSPRNLLLQGHHVRPGNKTVLLIRKFDTHGIFTVDDETFEKFSIEIGDYSLGVPIAINSANIRMYYSNGSSGFIYKGHGVYADSGEGTVTVKGIGAREITAEIVYRGVARPAGNFPFEGKDIEIEDTIIFKEKSISDLTPWLGTPCERFEREVYP